MGARGPAPAQGAARVGTVLTDAPPPPNSLPSAARAIWMEYAPIVSAAGLLTSADLLSFEMMCLSGARALEAAAVIAEKGMTTSGSQGQDVERPEVATEARSQDRFMRWADKFGLNAAARQRLAGSQKPEDPDEGIPEINATPVPGGG